MVTTVAAFDGARLGDVDLGCPVPPCGGCQECCLLLPQSVWVQEVVVVVEDDGEDAPGDQVTDGVSAPLVVVLYEESATGAGAQAADVLLQPEEGAGFVSVGAAHMEDGLPAGEPEKLTHLPVVLQAPGGDVHHPLAGAPHADELSWVDGEFHPAAPGDVAYLPAQAGDGDIRFKMRDAVPQGWVVGEWEQV